MFSIRLIYGALCVSACFSLAAQQPYRITLNERVIDDKARKLQSIVPMFRYPKPPFKDYSTFGLNTKAPVKTFTVKMPDLTGYKDTSYGYMHFGGAVNPQMSGYVFVLAVQNRRDLKPCIIWTDKNNNLDMTDDGAPDTLKANQAHQDIVLANPANPKAVYTCRISRFSLNGNMSYKMMLNDYYKEYSDGRYFAGADYSFKEQRMNIIAGDYAQGTDSFRIALKDVNCNGLYNEPGTDQIIIGNYGQKELSEPVFDISDKKGKTFFERNGKRFDINAVAETGEWVEITANTDAVLTRQLNTGKKLPKVKITLVQSPAKKIKLRKYRRKPTYVYFWNFEQPRFSEDTAALRELQKRYGNQINIITLNYGETPKELQHFITVNHINWIIGLSHKTINDKFFVERFPTTYYTARKLRLKQAGLSPAQLLDTLKHEGVTPR